jgi:DNA-binding NarL/FixJ family response regulator
MDGIEAVRPIKNLAPTTLILMLTTFFDAQLMKDALVAGVVDLLLKGNSPAQIIAAIRRATVQLRLP